MDVMTAAAVGLVAGAIASAVMDGFQRVAEPLFVSSNGSASSEEPSTEKMADDVSETVTGHAVPKPDKSRAGTIVHYTTGIAAGIAYVVIAAYWPPVTVGFGIVYGLALAIVLDNFLVPLLGLSGWAWQYSVGANVFGLVSHVVFGATLEGARRIGVALIGG